MCAMMLIMLIPLSSLFWLHSLRLVDAHTARENVGCGFHLSCSGSYNGTIGQKSSGQAHAISGGSPSLFTWFGDTFADPQGNGCWWTPPTYTLQCDRNQSPDHGFEIGCDGLLSFNGQTIFYECPTGQGDEVNIYLRPNGDQCHEITIRADNCAPSTCPGGGVGPAGASPVPGTVNSSTTSTTSPTPISSPTANTTPGGPITPSPFTISGGQPTTTTTSTTSTSTITTTAQQPTGCDELEPDSIILTDKAHPDTSYGPNPSRRIQVSPNASTIFHFPAFTDADLGRSCELWFRIPIPIPITTPNSNPGPPRPRGPVFNLTGNGVVTFAALDDVADPNGTTYRSTPRETETLANVLLFEGVDRGFARFPCPGAAARGSVLLTEAPLGDTCLDCLQGAGLGLFLRKCW